MTKGNLGKNEFLLAYSSREREAIVVGEAWQHVARARSQDLTSSAGNRKWRENQKRGKATNRQGPPPMPYFLHPGSTSKGSATSLNGATQLGTKGSNMWPYYRHLSFKPPQEIRNQTDEQGKEKRNGCLSIRIGLSWGPWRGLGFAYSSGIRRYGCCRNSLLFGFPCACYFSKVMYSKTEACRRKGGC